MSLIKEGFNAKPTYIKISKASVNNGRVAEVWIEQKGLEGLEEQRYETLAYATLDELLDLKAEINQVIKEIVA